MGIGIVISTTELVNSAVEGDVNGVVKASADLAMAYVGTLGLVGFGISVIYFVGTKTGAFDWIGDKVSQAYNYVSEKASNWWDAFIRQVNQFQNPNRWLR